MAARFLKSCVVFVSLSFVFFVSSFSLINSSSSSPNSQIFRRAKTVDSTVKSGNILGLMGIGVENMPLFSEGLTSFRQAVSEAKLTIEELAFLQGQVSFLHSRGYLSDADAEAGDSLLCMAQYYAQGLRRDQVIAGIDFKMLRFAEIKRMATVLQDAWQTCIQDGAGSEIIETMSRVSVAAQMAGLWATSPVSSTAMLQALAGGKSTVMAVNARYPLSIPGVMLAAQESGAPVMFEIAMSESNLEGGYTGQTPEMFADTVRYWAALLGFDLPYAIHADHTTVSKDTTDAIEKARALNQAQLAAGFTSFAIDPSSLPAVREATQLSVLNGMTQEDFMAIDGIGSILAQSLAEQGEFKSLKDVSKLFGEEKKGGFANLLNEIESRLLVKVLNGMTAKDLSLIPRISNDEVNRISGVIEQGGFKTIEELRTLVGERKVSIEGMGEVGMSDYLIAYLDLKRIVEISADLAADIPSDLGLEVEVGHVGRTDPITGQAVLTTPLEAVVFIESLHLRGIKPQLLAVNNGTKHGNVYVDGKLVPTSVDINRTAEIAQAIRPLGVAIAQHGTTGTPYDTLKNYLAGNLLKGNVGTFWQNIALANMPEALFKRMAQWTVEKYAKPGQFDGKPTIAELSRKEILADGSVYAAFLSDNIKNAIKPFKAEIDSMSQEDMLRIIEASRQGSYEWYNAFNARDKIWDIIDDLGWGWESPYTVYITDQVLLDEANLINILRNGEGGSLIVDKNIGTHIARLSRSGARILTYGGLSNAEVLQGLSEGRFEVVSQQSLIDQALAQKDKCILAFTGGGDSAGINAVIGAAASQLKTLGMTVLGVKNAGAGLIAAPENFRTQLILVDDLLAQDMVDQASTALGSSRVNPFKKEGSPEYESAMKNISGFGGFICTGGDDNLKTAAKIAELNPNAFVFATAKTIDGDVMVNSQEVRSLGFDSAAAAYRSEIYSIAQSAYTHGETGQPMVMFVETMGRDAGRLAFESARGDVFDGLTDAERRRQEELRDTILILTPEYPASLKDVEAAIRHKIAKYNCCTVVVAEGYTIPEYPKAGKTEVKDAFGNIRLEGIGQALAGLIEKNLTDLKVKIRSNSMLTYEGRGAMPTELDRIMGVRIGIQIASLINRGVTGGRFVGYTNAMNPLEEGPIVTELSGISNGNTLKLYPREVLLLNGVIME